MFLNKNIYKEAFMLIISKWFDENKEKPAEITIVTRSKARKEY